MYLKINHVFTNAQLCILIYAILCEYLVIIIQIIFHVSLPLKYSLFVNFRNIYFFERVVIEIWKYVYFINVADFWHGLVITHNIFCIINKWVRIYFWFREIISHIHNFTNMTALLSPITYQNSCNFVTYRMFQNVYISKYELL